MRTATDNAPPFICSAGLNAPFVNEDWEGLLEDLKHAVASMTGVVYSYIFTDGGVPTPSQRKQLYDAIQSRQATIVTHVFTTSPLIRGVITAYRWTTRKEAYGHQPEDFLHVCQSNGTPPAQVLRCADALQQDMPNIHMLTQIKSLFPPQPFTQPHST